MFKFTGTRKEFLAYLDKTFTRSAQRDDLVIQATLVMRDKLVTPVIPDRVCNTVYIKERTGFEISAEHLLHVKHCLREGKKIDALKTFRAATGCDLKNANNAIQLLIEMMGLTP